MVLTVGHIYANYMSPDPGLGNENINKCKFFVSIFPRTASTFKNGRWKTSCGILEGRLISLFHCFSLETQEKTGSVLQFF